MMSFAVLRKSQLPLVVSAALDVDPALTIPPRGNLEASGANTFAAKTAETSAQHRAGNQADPLYQKLATCSGGHAEDTAKVAAGARDA